MNYTDILNTIYEEVKSKTLEGKVASYIPELARIKPNKFGIYLLTVDGKEYKVGDNDEKFSIQSISKVLSLAQVMSLIGEKIWERIGVEPSGNSFNSIVQLEYENGIPRNPFINAGALVMADVLITKLKNPKKEFLEFVGKISGNKNIDYNLAVAKSEHDTGFMNASLVNMLKSRGNIHNKIEDVLDFYFHQCSIEMSCKDLANAFMIFANQGKYTHSIENILTGSQVKRINALMLSCGFYDESGEFAYKVGLPGKSGVGGGIVAVQPKEFSVAVWNPKLNKKGNSSMGMKALELLTTKTGMSIF
ncbi:MAG: glutaminase [Bacteroidetes bacterium]|nr:glutaminase [Bacteroidota bacterium]